ncbi:MAG: hypothetical protein ACPL3C_10525 [Pyrobaculum sp.]
MNPNLAVIKVSRESDFLLEEVARLAKIKKYSVVEHLPKCPLCRRSLLLQAAPGILRCPACGAIFELKRREYV